MDKCIMIHRHPGKYKSRTPRGRITYKKKPKHKFKVVKKKHKLNKSNRDIFQKLDKKPYETGGYLDFDKKGLERADVYIGKKASVDIEITPDKEVDWHTHPKSRNRFDNKINTFPSNEDIKSFKKFPFTSNAVTPSIP